MANYNLTQTGDEVQAYIDSIPVINVTGTLSGSNIVFATNPYSQIAANYAAECGSVLRLTVAGDVYVIRITGYDSTYYTGSVFKDNQYISVEIGESSAQGMIEDANAVALIPVTGTESGGNITLSSNPFTQVQTAVNAGQHVVVRVTIASDIIDFTMNTYSASVATYIGTANFLENEFQLLCSASSAVITNRSTSNTFTTGESVPSIGIDATPTQGSNNLVKSGGVYNEVSQLDQEVSEQIGPIIDRTITTFVNNYNRILLDVPIQSGHRYHIYVERNFYAGSFSVFLSTASANIGSSILYLAQGQSKGEKTFTAANDAKYLSFVPNESFATGKEIYFRVVDEDTLLTRVEKIEDSAVFRSEYQELYFNGVYTGSTKFVSGITNNRFNALAVSIKAGDKFSVKAECLATISHFQFQGKIGNSWSSLKTGATTNVEYELTATADISQIAIYAHYLSVSQTADTTLIVKTKSYAAFQKLEERVSELDGQSDYEIMEPGHLFGVESGSFAGREYATAIYPEAISFTHTAPEQGEYPDMSFRDMHYIKIEGQPRFLMQKSKQNTGTYNTFRTPVETIAKSIKVSGAGLIEKTINFNYIRANRYNAQNKKAFILIIGASITQQGGYPGYLQMFGDMDNADIGNLNIKVLGSNVGTVTPSISYEYNGQAKTIVTHTEGRAGWPTYAIANWPFEARADGAINTLGAEGMWYAAGLATKTPYNSNTAGQAWESWEGTTEQRLTAFTSVFGRFKPDYCEELWNALHNFHTRYRSGAHTIWYYSTGTEYVSGATIPTYNSATSDTIMEQFFDDLCDNPDNVFYDRDRARAYTGSYVWTNKTAFSVSKWVERYRTLDDDGNQLTLGDGTGTKITATNINNPVCTPTIIFCGLGANDRVGMNIDDWYCYPGVENAIKVGLTDLLDDLHTQIPAAKIGWGCPRQSGVFFPEDWMWKGISSRITFYTSHRDWLNRLMLSIFSPLAIENDYNYVPIYFTSSPLSGQSPHYVGDFDSADDNMLIVTGSDLGHVGKEWEQSVAYQILAWMYWCLQ